MIKAQETVLSRLGLYRVKAIVGGSMGGMQGTPICPLDLPKIFHEETLLGPCEQRIGQNNLGAHSL